MKQILFLILLSLFLFSACSESSTNASDEKKCDPVCESWQDCVDSKCETKDDFCSDDNDCLDSKACGENHTCEDKVVLKFTPCFHSQDEKCNGNMIPLPSDFMVPEVPEGTELNVSSTLPFTISFNGEINPSTLESKVLVFKDGEAYSDVVISKGEILTNKLLIKPSTAWEPGVYSVLLLNDIKTVSDEAFVETDTFKFIKSKTSLIDEDGKSVVELLDDASANQIELLRLNFVDELENLETSGMNRDDFLMLWNITIKDNFIACFKSLDVTGCENSPEVPLPSDFIMKDGYLNFPVAQSTTDANKAMLTAINTLDGWGVTSPFIINLSQDLDEISINSRSVMVLKLGAPRTAPSSVAIDVTWKTETKQLIISPKNGDIWRQKSSYVIILSDALRNKDGNKLIKSKIFSIAASKTTLVDEDGNSVYKGLSTLAKADLMALEGLRKAMSPLFMGMESANIKREDISMMYTVTTQTVTDDLMDLSLLLSSPGTPVDANPVIGQQSVMPHSMIPILLSQVGIDLDGYAQALGYDEALDLYSNLGYLVQGKLDLANYLGGTGAWDPVKIPRNPTVETVSFYMTIPYVKGDSHPDFCEMPATGFPVVIFQHGLGGSKEHILTLANEFSKNCYITIAIDAVKHGQRKVGEISGEGFFSPNLFASRDNLRQSVLDLVQLKSAINIMANPEYSSHLPGNIVFDKTKVSYFGISLGGILGTMFMTVSPDVNTGVLNVPGGGLIDVLLMTQAPSIKAPIINALSAQGIEEGTPEFEQFMFLGQLILDRADPIAYAYHTITEPLENENFSYVPKNILMQKAIDDEVINNYTTDHLAKVMGVYSAQDTDYFKTYTPAGTYGSKHSFIAGNEVSGQEAREDIIDFYIDAFEEQ